MSLKRDIGAPDRITRRWLQANPNPYQDVDEAKGATKGEGIGETLRQATREIGADQLPKLWERDWI
jgi:hypothetical protein